MTLTLYSIKDELNGFIPPTVLPNNETAKRWFQEMAETNITIKTSLKDFSLWEIGEFDGESGKIIGHKEPKLIIRGESYGE